MDLKKFNSLSLRDFENGAVIEEIADGLKERDALKSKIEESEVDANLLRSELERAEGLQSDINLLQAKLDKVTVERIQKIIVDKSCGYFSLIFCSLAKRIAQAIVEMVQE